jgi:hypothetical protein
MSTSPTPEDLRRGLEYVLQETDAHRELDSVETVTVQAYLTGQGFPVPDGRPQDPQTIAGWLAWAAHCSPAS